METITVGKIKINVPMDNALYRHYPGQYAPQDAYVEIDPETWEISASYNAEIGNAVPAAVWHGRIRRYQCRVLTDVDALLLMRKIVPLAEKICSGYDSRWDGNNIVGRLDDAATIAEDELSDIIATATGEMDIWDAGEWLGVVTHYSTESVVIDDIGTITADTTDEQIGEMTIRANELARDENVFLGNSVVGYLKNLRDNL